jgi:hypothetical protein
MKTMRKQKIRFQHGFAAWLRNGEWRYGGFGLDAYDHANRPHIEADIGGGLCVRATAYSDGQRLADGGTMCGMYLAAYCMSDFVTFVGPHKLGIVTDPAAMDAAAAELLDEVGIDCVIEVVRLELSLRQMKVASLRRALAARKLKGGAR